jgi:hypothetical protein
MEVDTMTASSLEKGREVCSYHPNYEGNRYPKSKCEVCIEIYRATHPLQKRGRKKGGKNVKH